MDIITKVFKGKKESTLTINDDYTFKINPKKIEQYKTEEEINVKEVIKENYDYLYDAGFNMAINYLTYAQRCENDIKEYLNRKKFHYIIVNDIVNRLLELKYINDEEYIKNYILSKSSMLIGRNKLKYDLINKKINPDLVVKTLLLNFSKEEEIENLKQFILKQNNKYKNTFAKEKKTKIINSAIRKGYNYTLINNIIDEIIDFEDNNNNDNEILKEKIKKRFYKYINKNNDLNKAKYNVFSFYYKKGASEEILNEVYEEVKNELNKKY